MVDLVFWTKLWGYLGNYLKNTFFLRDILTSMITSVHESPQPPGYTVTYLPLRLLAWSFEVDLFIMNTPQKITKNWRVYCGITIFSLKSLFLSWNHRFFSLSFLWNHNHYFCFETNRCEVAPFAGYPFDGKIKGFRLSFYIHRFFGSPGEWTWITCVRKIPNHQLLRGNRFLSPGNPLEPWWRWGLSTEMLPEPCKLTWWGSHLLLLDDWGWPWLTVNVCKFCAILGSSGSCVVIVSVVVVVVVVLLLLLLLLLVLVLVRL